MAAVLLRGALSLESGVVGPLHFDVRSCVGERVARAEGERNHAVFHVACLHGGAAARDLHEEVAKSAFLLEGAGKVFLKAELLVGFPKVAHGVGTAVGNDFLLFDFFPKGGPRRRRTVRHPNVEDFYGLGDGVGHLLRGEREALAARLVAVAEVLLLVEELARLNGVNEPVGPVHVALEETVLLCLLLHRRHLVCKALVHVGDAAPVLFYEQRQVGFFGRGRQIEDHGGGLQKRKLLSENCACALVPAHFNILD